MTHATVNNQTDAPCAYNWGNPLPGNCTIHRVTFRHFGHPVCAAISILGLFLNIIVVLVIHKSMTIGKRRTQAQIHLLVLGYSDLAVCAATICWAVFSWACDPCAPCKEASACFHFHTIAYFFWFISFTANQWLTVFITYIRARALWSINGALISQNKTQNRMLLELVGATALCCIAVFLLLFIAKAVFDFAQIPFHIGIVWVLLSLYVLKITTMMVLTINILIKLRFSQSSSSVSQRSAGATTDDFQKLVALVAAMFCCTQLVAGVNFVLILNADDMLFAAEQFLWINVVSGFNCSFNLVIYVIASRNFRIATKNFWTNAFDGASCENFFS